jgi:5-methylcytosine-specific restriction protein A
MPNAAPRICTKPGCGVLVHGASRCPAHRVVEGSFADRRRGSRHERGYGSEWDKRRVEILRRDGGVCQPHQAKGIVHPGNIVDHRTPKAEGGTDEPGNLWCVCGEFHREKTQLEAARGRARAR